MARQRKTIDPTQIQNPSQIPPAGAQHVGLSSQGLVDIYYGTLSGDVDAQPAAKELLGTSSDTGGLSNADYIYQQVSKLYGGAQLPAFQSPSGNQVKSVVFISGSKQGGYGAFHFPGSQTDFDRIVCDSLNASGTYSAGSGLPRAMAPAALKLPHILTTYRGAGDLLGVVADDDASLTVASVEAIQEAHASAARSINALANALATRNPSARLPETSRRPMPEVGKDELVRQLIRANQDIVGLVRAAAGASGGRQYLATALFAAEIVESFELLTSTANAGQTDGEAVSRVLAYKLAPEISLVPGFNSAVMQQWWKDGHPDFANVNSENDQSTDGNAAGVMFLEFLTDYLGIALDQILAHMPQTGGAPLGQTYVNLLKDYPQAAQAAGQDGPAAFQKMVSLLQANAQNPDGSLNLPADGNPFPSIPGAKQGGLFAGSTPTPGTGSLGPDTQAAIGLETQIEQQLATLKGALQQIQGDLAAPAPQLSADLTSAVGQVETLGRAVGNLTSLLQKMKGEAPTS